MSRRTHLIAAGLVCLPAVAFAMPEGTPQLGVSQGLEGNSILLVDVVNEGERIRVCSSDDGRQEPRAGDFNLDLNPGEANPVPEERRGAEILLSRPVREACRNDGECAGDFRCRSVVDGSAFNGQRADGQCAIPLSVTQQEGYCNAQSGPGNWIEVPADRTGKWVLNFVGEPDTRTDTGRSTR